MTGVAPDSLLLVLPVPFRVGDGRLWLEKQACNGVQRWADNFRTVTVACPVQPPDAMAGTRTSVEYRDVARLECRERVEFVPLPWAYGFFSFARRYRGTRRILAARIRASRYLSFAIGGLVGDWPSVAALEALRQKRRFSIWTDAVAHRVVRKAHLDSAGIRRVYQKARNNLVYSPLMARLERHIIARCDLGLFHGSDCFSAYERHCRAAYLVHDIHLTDADRIPESQAAGKIGRLAARQPLRLLYAGRLVAIKGPFDWLDVMQALKRSSVRFSAAWLGDGPLLEQARARARRLGLDATATLPGFVGDRDELLARMRDADLFVFCHKAPESPRCLIEALMSGTPIVGYDSPFARDLLGEAADALLVPPDDTAALARRVIELDSDRARLMRLTERCCALGAKYSDRAVFRHRSELIKRHL